MSDLRQFFSNPFQRESIAADTLRIFTYDHLQRLAAVNGSGDHNARLTDTVNAFADFEGHIIGTELNRTLQLAATSEMFLRWTAFIEWAIQRGEPRITEKTGRTSALYAQFFPSGMEELHRVTLHHAEPILDRMASLVTGEHAGNGRLLGPEFVTQVTGRRRGYLRARHAQLALRGELPLRVSMGGGSEARAALEHQLFGNLLALLQQHHSMPLGALPYFSLSLLDFAAPAPVVIPIPIPVPLTVPDRAAQPTWVSLPS